MQRLIHGRLYYGWILVPVGCICYGLGIAPAYGSWGFFAPELREELGLSRADIGSVFGAFSLFLLAVGPLTAWVINRYGLRVTITCGALIASAGMALLSQADTLWECYFAYSVLCGIGLASSTALPMQTLATFWFKKYRARALAVILAGGTGVGAVVAPINDLLLQYGGWRFGWQVYSGISLLVALIAVTFIRNKPEECGLSIDGQGDEEPVAVKAAAASPTSAVATKKPRVWDTILTPQFFLISLCALGQLGPWTVFTSHGRLHMDMLLMSSTVAAGLLSLKNVTSTIGRLSASGADWVSPRFLLSVAMIVEATGFAGIALSHSPVLAYTSAIFFGAGYGAAMICVSLSFAEVFGREAFVTTTGASKALQGGFNFVIPIVAGAVADRMGTYAPAFLGLSLLGVIGAIGILFCRPIYEPPQAAGPVAPKMTAPSRA